MKAEVVVEEMKTTIKKPVHKPTVMGPHIKCNNLNVKGNSIQDIYDKDTKEVLLTTAFGVAPNPELMYNCFWLRGDNVKWEIVQHNGNRILVPTRIEK